MRTVEGMLHNVKEFAGVRLSKFAEELIGELEGFDQALDKSYDLRHGDKKIEVKCSRVIIDKGNDDIIDKVLLDSKDMYDTKWICNMQQVKTYCFNILYYIIFFQDIIYIFKMDSNCVKEDKNINYQHKQHRGNINEGQIHIKPSNIKYHIDNYLHAKIEYEKFIELTKHVKVH